MKKIVLSLVLCVISISMVSELFAYGCLISPEEHLKFFFGSTLYCISFLVLLYKDTVVHSNILKKIPIFITINIISFSVYYLSLYLIFT